MRPGPQTAAEARPERWRIPRYATIFCCGALATAARGQMEFSGHIRQEGKTRFVLTDTATGKTSDFLEIGGGFGGHTIVAFDAKREVLAVKKGDVVAELPLRTARAQDAGTAATAQAGDGRAIEWKAFSWPERERVRKAQEAADGRPAAPAAEGKPPARPPGS